LETLGRAGCILLPVVAITVLSAGATVFRNAAGMAKTITFWQPGHLIIAFSLSRGSFSSAILISFWH